MAIVVGAVYMPVAGLAALVTNTDYVSGNFFSHAIIKHKILSDKFSLQPFCLYLAGVIDDAAIELVHIAETMMADVRACFLTTDSAGTIQ